MPENADYDPGPWQGHDFQSARKAFDVNAGRSYEQAVVNNSGADDLVPKFITTSSKSPLVIAVDVTGSMDDFPRTIFSKLPYLDKEGKEYLGDDMETSFCAIGDLGKPDKFPLQVRRFVNGLPMEKEIKELVIEGGGGGNGKESYELAALYYARNCRMPDAVRKPIFILIGDEDFYDRVTGDASAWTHSKVDPKTTGVQAFGDLKKKFSVYLIRKPYDRSLEHEIHQHWEELLGADHVLMLPDPTRVVDVIFGILAKETNKGAYFKAELTGRQTADQVQTVMKSLNSIRLLTDATSKKAAKSMKLLPGASMTRRPDDGKSKNSVSLL